MFILGVPMRNCHGNVNFDLCDFELCVCILTCHNLETALYDCVLHESALLYK